MKPTPQQDTTIRQYLRDSLRYRETYEEVYDHVLTALEQRPFTGTLEEAVNQILREDFGGYDQMRAMENDAKRQVISDGVSKYLKFFASYFRWPRVFYTLGAVLVVYFTLAQVKLEPIVFEAIFAMVVFTPGILSLRRYYIVGYIFKDTKRSIRDDVFSRIATVPTRLVVFVGLFIIINMDKGKNIFDNATPPVLTALYVLSGVYLLSLVELYKDEFKLSITK
ncbi:fatty acid desaturase family protein [Mucilaginibacter myungsuensis]|uniref:Uncharacterized protein n=1 Tax=Mucilaginibacter myungsuensis TaxID=649104 RepID=A0A929PWR6_9SPHI|nr:hypothetical protein [Mucilaginibacter myungsuensis]MBE9662376.1 hypothetical protein [Mucilaginibacter myungsuensis]MDN3599187.1 hypothetical protein [Mucilaginibacter myungsuensis]